MHRDVPVIHDEIESIDGVVVPMHILAYQTPSTSAFLTSLTPEGRGYLIDPMTFIFQTQKRALTKVDDETEDRHLRISIHRLCTELHPTLAGTVEGMDGPDAQLGPGDFPNIDAMTENAIQFQLEAVDSGANESAASKYLERYPQYQVAQPRAVVPPYFRFDVVGSDWYDLSRRSAQTASALGVDPPVAPVVCCPAGTLDEASVEKIVNDFGEFEQVILWIDGYREREVDPVVINRVRNLIAALNNEIDRIETLYGGYLMLLASNDGLDAVSHGILYTQGKSYTSTPGGGGPIERFYLPRIHQFRSLSQTDYILQRCPDLMCQCEICHEHLGGDPEQIIKYADNPELLRRHFLKVRRLEADSFPTENMGAETRALELTYQRYHPVFRQLPNPDAWVSDAPMPGLGYLHNWANAF